MTLSPRPILILHEAVSTNARPDETDALTQVEFVAGELRKLARPVSVLATDLNLQATLAAITGANPACIFNLVESINRDGRLIHVVPALLAGARIRCTGSGSDALYLSSQKLLAKQWMRLHGIPTPQSFVPGDEKPTGNHTWIVKSVWEHASFGLDDGCVVNNLAAVRARIDHSQAQYGGEWFAEQFIDGREFNIAVLEVDGQTRILPIAEMSFVDYPHGKPKIVGYAAKWDEAAPEYSATQRSFPALPDAQRDAILDVTHKCWRAFGLSGYARVDIRMDAAGVPWVLEVNGNPCLSPDAGFIAAASEAGFPPGQVIESVVRAALN
jgi:D-alanine-D-alanine ligase